MVKTLAVVEIGVVAVVVVVVVDVVVVVIVIQLLFKYWFQPVWTVLPLSATSSVAECWQLLFRYDATWQVLLSTHFCKQSSPFVALTEVNDPAADTVYSPMYKNEQSENKYR